MKALRVVMQSDATAIHARASPGHRQSLASPQYDRAIAGMTSGVTAGQSPIASAITSLSLTLIPA